MSARTKRDLLIIAVLLLAFGLRMWHLNTESVWHDEGWSIRAMRGPFTTPDDNTPFIYYFSGHLLWRLGAGESPLAFRYVSVLIGLVTVALGMHIGRRWFGYQAGLTSGILLGTSPLLWEYSQEVRAYVAVPLIALALLMVADRILQAKRVPPQVWLMAFSVQLLGLYTHNLSVPLIVWLNLALGIVWLLRRDWRKMLIWGGGELVLIAAYTPWLLTQSPSGTPLNSPPQPSLTLAHDIWASYFLPVLAQLRAVGFNWVGALGLVAISIVGVALTRRRDDKSRMGLLLSHALLVPVFSTLLITIAHIDFHPRYYIASAAGTLLLLVAAISQLRRLYIRTSVVAVLIAGLSLHQITTMRSYQHDDFRGLAEYYATLPEDTVILIPFNVERALQDYYANVLDIRAQFVNVPLYANEETVLTLINDLAADGTRHVEFLTWFQLPADARGMYPCLLTAAHTGQLENPRFYFGLSTQRYDIQPIQFMPLAIKPTYQMVNFIRADYTTSPAGTCIRTTWEHAASYGDNLNVSAAVHNPLQQPIAHSDAQIARSDNVGTSLWHKADQGSAYNLLRLPDGVPKLKYDVVFGVYAPIFPAGFDLLDKAGNPIGKTFTGTIVAQGAALPLTQPTLQASSSDQIEAGLPFDVTLYIPQDAQRVVLTANGWQGEQPVTAGLSWHRFVVPPGNTGEARLSVDGTILASFPVLNRPRLFIQPKLDTKVGVLLPDIATLVGVSLEETTLTADSHQQVTLVWQPTNPVHIDYTVFVQLLSADGQLLAQSDAQPERPTSSWIAGEYIIDTHTLQFNSNDYTGAATLIAGMYDANFQRMTTANGLDHILIDTELWVE